LFFLEAKESDHESWVSRNELSFQSLYEGNAMRLFILIATLGFMAMPLASCGTEPTSNDQNDTTSTPEDDVSESTDAGVAGDASAEEDAPDNSPETDSGAGVSTTDATARVMEEVTETSADDVTEPVDQEIIGDEDTSCQPACDGKTCGKDGCGGSCGSCSDVDAPVCKVGECVLLIFCDAYFEQCPNDGATSDPAMLDVCKANCEQQFLGGCWFAACAVETGFCDNEEEDDASIVACGIANGWFEPSESEGIPIE